MKRKSTIAPPGQLARGYQVAATEQLISRTPSWNAIEENPPLSARRALELAAAKKDRLARNDHDWQWHFDALTLQRFPMNGNPASDYGYWLATFHASQDAGAAG